MSHASHGCGAAWNRAAQAAHCSSCHRTFANVTAFDRHFLTQSGVRFCTDPRMATHPETFERLFEPAHLLIAPEGEWSWRLRSSSPNPFTEKE